MSDDRANALPPIQPDNLPDALEFLTNPKPDARLKLHRPPFGGLDVFSHGEGQQLRELRGMIRRYAAQSVYERPFCLAVFGPPGSGKSFGVKEIVAQAGREEKEDQNDEQGQAAGGNGKTKKVPPLGVMETLNLTQMADTETLAHSLAGIAERADRKNAPIPVVFFDEFDASRAGAAYGWLSWFLAPMHDGELTAAGHAAKLKRAIYVFAGGTADTMAEFSARSAERAFRHAKGPDFVSRLRGFLDVRGPNAEPRTLRRAVILRKEIKGRGEALALEKAIETTPKLLESMLRAHYVHGARSIGAVLEMSAIGADGKLDFNQLAPNDLMKQHATAGPLDPEVLGGFVALSGFPDQDDPADLREVWIEVTKRLWEEGATLAYGGQWGNVLLTTLCDQVSAAPQPLRRSGDGGRFRVWCYASGNAQNAPKQPHLVEVAAPPEFSEKERASFDGAKAGEARARLRESILRFRKRLDVSERSLARFAVAGKTVGFHGRFSGIAEEVMLTLALGKPVYIAGACDGAARQVGALLGLQRPWMDEDRSIFAPTYEEGFLELLGREQEKFRPPPWTSLPVNQKELIDFLQDHAIEGKKWPDNGLTPEQNRELFTTTDGTRIAELVILGLRRRFDRRS